MNHEKGLRSQTSPRALGHKMQPGTLEWTLGCITSTAWGLLTIPGTLHPVPRARPFGARAVPPYSSGFLCRLGGSLPALPTPLEGQMRFAHDAQSQSICPSCNMMQNQLQGGVPQKSHKLRLLWPGHAAQTWEATARPQGLVPSRTCRERTRGKWSARKSLRRCSQKNKRGGS